MNAHAHVIRWMRRPLAPALLLLPMLLLGAYPGVAFAGRISGQVLDEYGAPVPYARVTIRDAGEAEIAVLGCDWLGFYETEKIPAGKYLVHTAENEYLGVPGSRLLPRWYGDAATSKLATPVAVAAEGVTRGIDVHLPRGGTISGRVTGADDAPVDFASVEVIPWEEGNGGSGFTGRDGTYRLDSLEPGSYKIRFRAPARHSFQTVWHPGAAPAEVATLVTIGLGEEVVGIDGALPPGGSISGRVTGVGGVPLSSCTVRASPAGWGYIDENSIHTTSTNGDGEYRITGLATGSYNVVFEDYLWYPAHSSPEGAGTVAVVAGVDTPGIHGRLGASIAGRVTTTGGAPAEGVRVMVGNPAFTWWRHSAITDATGAYLIRWGVMPGTYRVCFEAQSNNPVKYLPRCYDGHAAGAGFDPVTVEFDQTTTGIDAVMEPGGSISGRITGPVGIVIAKNLGGVGVYDTTGTRVTWSEVDEEGYYQVHNLPAGRYRLFVGHRGQYAPTWYPGVADPEAATEIESGPGLDLSGIDWELPVGGVITGIVTNPDGSGVPLVRVKARRTNDDTGWSVYDSTDANGRYRVQGLQAGEHTLYFSHPIRGKHSANQSPLVGRWYDGKRTEAQADPVTVRLGETTSGIDTSLPRGGSITGQVTDAGGEPLTKVSVLVEPVGGADDAYAGHPDPRGQYVVRGLPRGEYRVRFVPWWGTDYVEQWYRERARSKGAEEIVVVEGGTVRGIDARITRGGHVVGQVTDARGVALGGGSVEGYKGRDIVWEAEVDQHGFYASGLLAPGGYRLRFVPPPLVDGSPDGFLPQWYRRRDAAADADSIVVEPGVKKTVNVRLERGGVITGRVTAAGDPFRSVSVAAYAAEGGDVVSETRGRQLSLGGRYRLDGLPSGSYRIEFKPWDAPFLPQWYDGRPPPEEADLVSVTAGAVTPGIDAVLAPVP